MKEKIAVIYKSKYGSTKRYAGWIALKLDADLYEINDIRSKDLKQYDTIIYGGGVYIGKINGIDLINKNWDIIKDKNVMVFTVGLETSFDKFNSIIEKNINKEILDCIKIFNFQGGFYYKSLSFIDKIIIKKVKNDIDKKNIRDLTLEDKILLQGFDSEVDLCNKKSIDLLIESV